MNEKSGQIKKEFSYKDFQFLDDDQPIPCDAFDTQLKMYAFSDYSRARIMGHNKINKFGLLVKGIDIIFNTNKSAKFCLFLNYNEFPEIYDNLDINVIFKNWIVYDYFNNLEDKTEQSKANSEQALQNIRLLFNGEKVTVPAEKIATKELFDKIVEKDVQYRIDNQTRYEEGYDAVEFGADPSQTE